MFKDILQEILKDLDDISKKSEEEIFEHNIKNSLNISYENYCARLDKHSNVLLNSNNLRVLKAVKERNNSKNGK